jgi:maltokinase
VLARQFAAGTKIDRPSGCVSFHWDEAFAPPSEQPAMRTMGAEQSNTSVVLDERLALKVFRRIQPGINPELEMLRFLAAHAFPNIAALTGWYTYTGELMDATLGVVQRYIGGSRDGWELALDALMAQDRSFLGRLGELGAATGRMHAVLASASDDPAFAPEEPTVETSRCSPRRSTSRSNGSSTSSRSCRRSSRSPAAARRFATTCGRSRTSASADA